MLQNAYFLAKIGADTAENEQHFAEILPIGRRVADRCPGRRRGPGTGRRPGEGRKLAERDQEVRHTFLHASVPGYLLRRSQ